MSGYGGTVRIGLTGGVGSGKSTVARLLAGHGAVVIDADAIARAVVEPGTEGFGAVVTRFGAAVVAPDGTLDRPALAAIVFADDRARADLNTIVHPLVRQRSDEVGAAARPGAMVVYDIPLLVESGSVARYDAVVVVETAVALRVQRLAARGLSEADARARMAAQATDEQRRAVADIIIVNDGDLDQLSRRVDLVWVDLMARSPDLPPS